MNAYLSFLLYLAAILGFVAVTLWLNRIVGPKPVSSDLKLEPFECGAMPVQREIRGAVAVKYSAIAVVFIVFDLETAFLIVWALAAQPLTGTLLFTLGLFLALLVLILAYVWKSGLIQEVVE
jgi:NADH-quinone oxidoreductase subunit A